MSDRHTPEVRKIIGISGGSGAGKTTLANALVLRFELTDFSGV
jgi:uridine kinase